MFAVKEMCEHCLSNMVTSKKKTIINTDEFVTKEHSITHDKFIECYKGFTHVHQEVFPSKVHADFCHYVRAMLWTKAPSMEVQEGPKKSGKVQRGLEG